VINKIKLPELWRFYFFKINRFRSGAEKTPYYPSLINEKEILKFFKTNGR